MNWSVADGTVPVPVYRDGTAYHSRYNPQREAERWVQQEQAKRLHPAAVAIVIGTGFGYHLAELRAACPDLPLFALEPDAELAALARTQRGSELLPPGTRLFAGDDCRGTGLANTIVQAAGGLQGVWTLVHPVALRYYPDAVKEILAQLQLGMAFDLTSLCTEQHFALLWLRNALANLPHTLRACAANTLRVLPARVPAVIIGASPHLDAHLDTLRDLAGRVLLVACDTALTPLTEAGIKPHLVVCADPQQANTEHFTGQDRSIPLVFDTAVYPDIWERHDAELLFAGDVGTPLARFLAARGGAISDWLAGGSVASIALQAAWQAGAGECRFVGIDYAYPAGRVYARGTRSHRLLLEKAERFVPPDTGERLSLLARHADGTPLSDPMLRQYADWMNDYAARCGCPCYRSDEESLLTLPRRDLRELCARPPADIVLQGKPLPWSPALVRAALEELQAELQAWEQGNVTVWRARGTTAAGAFVIALLPVAWRAVCGEAPEAAAAMHREMAAVFPEARRLLAAAVDIVPDVK